MIAGVQILACALVLSSTVVSATAAEHDFDVFLFGVPLDQQTDLVWAIKRSRLLAIPAWQPGGSEAPLSPNKAVSVANNYVQSVLGVHGATVISIHMLQLGHGSDNRWAYNIDYSLDPPKRSDDPRLHVTVAMDGKVIDPVKRPR
jgi:hypothetical protein